jgi:hypothetical protein
VPLPVFWATGACLLIRSHVYRALGGFDERFFAHMEEIDLCWRIKQQGMQVFVVPQSTVFHVGGGTLPKKNPRKTFFNFRNNLLMLSKNLPWHTLLWLIPLRLILDGIAGFKFLLEGDVKDTGAVFRAHMDFYRLSLKKSGTITHKATLNAEGIYQGSILADYFIRGIRSFSDLPTNRFPSRL